jgi:hypothetical protein
MTSCFTSFCPSSRSSVKSMTSPERSWSSGSVFALFTGRSISFLARFWRRTSSSSACMGMSARPPRSTAQGVYSPVAPSLLHLSRPPRLPHLYCIISHDQSSSKAEKKDTVVRFCGRRRAGRYAVCLKRVCGVCQRRGVRRWLCGAGLPSGRYLKMNVTGLPTGVEEYARRTCGGRVLLSENLGCDDNE